MSYQHIFHAGNLADVHKHGLMAWVLDYLTQKDKPLTYIETHAGRGLYRLDAPEAVKTGEAAAGIGRVADWFGADHPYARVRDLVVAEHGPAAYPGSPMLAALLLRDMDSLMLAELHPQEFAALNEVMKGRGIRLENRDGLELALAVTPPDPRRGVLLIDPSWEMKTDYDTVPRALDRIARKWPVGILSLWYPILADGRHRNMVGTLTKTFPDALKSEVRFPPHRAGHGMVGSGMVFVNPPWGLDQEAARLAAKFAELGG
nr:23S rRNA (adenine(2030)-N(6))-methyltransferase RlmJ [Maritimibacter sp. DP1N21-5]